MHFYPFLIKYESGSTKYRIKCSISALPVREILQTEEPDCIFPPFPLSVTAIPVDVLPCWKCFWFVGFKMSNPRLSCIFLFLLSLLNEKNQNDDDKKQRGASLQIQGFFSLITAIIRSRGVSG